MSAPDEPVIHHISLAVWDLASPVVVGRRATFKVGVSCSCGCDLSGTSIDVCDEARTKIGGGALGAEPWTDTRALYWTELDIPAPDTKGEHAWSIRATHITHEPVRSTVRVVVVRAPEHRVACAVTKKESGEPVAGVELRLGPFSGTTDEHGVACIDVGRGSYSVLGWKIGFDMLFRTVHVTADTRLSLEIAATPKREQPYWM